LVLAPVLSLLLGFGVYPRLLTDRIDPTTRAVIAHVDPAHATEVGPATGLAAASPGASP
jgi:NADH:ubiquinone oxidoreductase subunit 4 (subunit M)